MQCMEECALLAEHSNNKTIEPFDLSRAWSADVLVSAPW